MSTTHLIQTIIEFLVIGAIIVGFIYEPALAKWERKQKEKVLREFKERRKYRR